jgi:hypothetical protein
LGKKGIGAAIRQKIPSNWFPHKYVQQTKTPAYIHNLFTLRVTYSNDVRKKQ